jgi:hypothetical protein
MSESSIKETMDRLYGVGTVPRETVPADEMKQLIAKSKVQLRAKKGKNKSKKTESAEVTEKGGMDNYPCPRCKQIGWMEIPDETGRYYCLKCGEVIQYPSIEAKDTKKITEQHEIPAAVSECDEAEKNVDQINPVNEQITETENKGSIYCEYRCNDCQEIVIACGNSLEKAKNLVAFHKGCGGRLIFVRQVNPKIAGNKERFSHPRVERAICNGCSDDMGGCPRTFKRMVACLLNNVDYKVKWLRSG